MIASNKASIWKDEVEVASNMNMKDCVIEFVPQQLGNKYSGGVHCYCTSKLMV